MDGPRQQAESLLKVKRSFESSRLESDRMIAAYTLALPQTVAASPPSRAAVKRSEAVQAERAIPRRAVGA